MKQNNKFELSLVVAGKNVREYQKDGNTFVEGKDGSEYIVKFKNNHSKRVMVIFSIDGLEPLKGEKAEDCKIGYIVNANSSFELKGFRIDNNNVAAFKFGKRQDSYAATNGDILNVGVVGVRVFEEKVTKKELYVRDFYKDDLPYVPYKPITPTPYPQPYYPQYPTINPIWKYETTCGTTDIHKHHAILQAQAQGLVRSVNEEVTLTAKSFDLGTEWGNKVESKVREVDFEVGKQLTTLTLYYASKEGLEKMGIEIEKFVQLPKAFAEGKVMYCKPPANWKG
jgi:hypothetical protein